MSIGHADAITQSMTNTLGIMRFGFAIKQISQYKTKVSIAAYAMLRPLNAQNASIITYAMLSDASRVLADDIKLS
jgi:hypothetical protein